MTEASCSVFPVNRGDRCWTHRPVSATRQDPQVGNFGIHLQPAGNSAKQTFVQDLQAGDAPKCSCGVIRFQLYPHFFYRRWSQNQVNVPSDTVVQENLQLDKKESD